MKGCSLKSVLISVLYLSVAGDAGAQQSDSTAPLKEQIVEARQQGEMATADQLAQQLLQQAQAKSSPLLEAEALYLQGRNAMERNQYPQAQTLLSRSIEIYLNQNARAELGEAYRQLGLTYRYQANYPTALEYIYLSMQIFEQTEDQNAISSAYNSIGVVLEKMGQYEEASQAHHKALQINYELGDDAGIATALFNLGDIRRIMGDYELALKYFNDALKMDLASGNVKDIAYSHHKIGYLSINLEDYEKAREHITKALELFRQIETPRDTDWALTSLAELELKLGNFDQAKTLIDGVIQRAIENQYNSLLVDAYLVASELAFEQQDFTLALALIEAGLKQASANKERAQEAELEELRVKVHLANDSLKQAFDALQRQKQLDDELLNEKRLDSIARVQAQVEFVRRAHQIELLEKEKALQNAMAERQQITRNFWLWTVVAAFVLLFLLYGRVLQRRANRRLGHVVSQRTKELEIKNQELAKAYEDMEAISLTDKLTAIHNRRFLENHIEADFEQCIRVYQDWRDGKTARPAQADIAFFICDMDNFKQVNDQYGHNAGDRVLQQFAQRMAKVFRHSDYLVRWGGEEFIGVARFIQREDAKNLASRMLEVISERPFEMADGHLASQTCSIGFACYPPMPQSDIRYDLATIMSLADACLYEVKTSGKNSWMGVSEVTDKHVFSAEVTQQDLPELIAQQKLTICRPGDTNESD